VLISHIKLAGLFIYVPGGEGSWRDKNLCIFGFTSDYLSYHLEMCSVTAMRVITTILSQKAFSILNTYLLEDQIQPQRPVFNAV
jgi:hypothetical protein